MFEETMETTAVETTAEATSGIMGTVMKIAIPTVALLLGIGVGYGIEKYRMTKTTEEPKVEQQKTEDK